MSGFPVDSLVERAVAPWTDRSVRAGVGTSIALVGTILVAILLSRSLQGYTNPFGLFLGGVFPLGLAASVTVGGILLAVSRYSGPEAAHVGLWWALGSVVASTTGVAIVLFENAKGVAVTEPAVIIAGNAATGGLGGIVVGVSVARRLSVARERERERERLADERERFALLNRIVRHDIGNDLQVIAGMADHLDSHVESSGRVPLKRLQQTSAEAIELTEQVRTFVQALDDDAVERRPISLQRVLETQLSNTRERYPEAMVQLDGDVPNVEVLADELLSTVVRNLLSNAVSHNDTDSPSVDVTVQVRDDTVRLRIADDGPGVPDQLKEQLFDRGERGETSSGTGIGLYIVETLVKRYGGAVWVEDNEPRGAVFIVDLPRSPPEVDEREAPRHEQSDETWQIAER